MVIAKAPAPFPGLAHFQETQGLGLGCTCKPDGTVAGESGRWGSGQAHEPTPTLALSGGASLPTAPLRRLPEAYASRRAGALLGLQGPRVSTMLCFFLMFLLILERGRETER